MTAMKMKEKKCIFQNCQHFYALCLDSHQLALHQRTGIIVWWCQLSSNSKRL